eukprot:6756947-Karenia_brevis.AAC.1
MSRWSWKGVPFPSEAMLEAIIARLKNSACGFDGVINAGWKPIKELAARILWLVLILMSST